MTEKRQVVLLFVDGLGLGSTDPAANPIHSGVCASLEEFLRDHAVPIDASLGMEGLPQSATGQTVLLTGVDAIHAMGRHVEGFPGSQLKAIIHEHNIFKQLAARGRTSTFANAYFADEVETVVKHRLHSVTTAATLSAFGAVRCRAEMEKDDAVYQDITREALVPRGYTGPLVTPAAAAAHLARIAADFDFTLFEYFQTDRAGHATDAERVRKVLAIFDEFLAAFRGHCRQSGILLTLTSDHGNIEDSSAIRHTLNPVPFAAEGPGAETLRSRVRTILDVTPAIVEWLCGV